MSTKQHVQVAHDLCKNLISASKTSEEGLLKSAKLEYTDVLVYTNIKKYMNEQRIAFPSVDKIKKDCGMSKPAVLKAIERLSNNGDFTITKNRGRNFYMFNEKSPRFEMFSYEFLENDELTPQQKAYLIIVQQFMFKDQKKAEGKIQYSDAELSAKLGLSEYVITSRRRELEALGVIETKLETIAKPVKIGDSTELIPQSYDARYYKLKKIFQDLVLMRDTVNQHTDDISEIKDELKSLREELKALKQK